MNKYCETKLFIYESYDAGYINELEKQELLNLLKESSEKEFFIEKMSRDDRARDKFKKKYNFKPDENDKYGNHGTITVHGKEVPINMSKSTYISGKTGKSISNKEKVSSNDNSITRRQSAVANDKNNTITLDKNFFKLKNQDRRDAVLNHELTHRNFQSPSADDDKRVGEIRKAYMKKGIDYFKHKKGMSDIDIYTNLGRIRASIDEAFLNNKPYKSTNTERSEAFKKVSSKYNDPKLYHLNGLEKEADIGGAKATSTKTMTKALNEMNKLYRKDDNNKKANTGRAREFELRSKSLKDSENKNIDYYNKNMPRKSK